MQFFFSGYHFLRQLRKFALEIKVNLIEVPEDLMKMLIQTDAKCSHSDHYHLDLGNTIIVGKSHQLLPKGWLCVKTDYATRLAFLLQLPIRMKNSCFASSQLIQNLFPKHHAINNKSSGTIINIFPEAVIEPSAFVCASSMKLALLNNNQPISNDDVNEKLKNYFSIPKYIQVNDVVKVDNHLSFVVRSLSTEASKKQNNLGFFVDTTTSVYQQISSQPSLKIFSTVKMKSNVMKLKLESFQDLQTILDSIISTIPSGLNEYCSWIRKVIEPFIFQPKSSTSSNLPSYPTFLISGKRGSGKRTIVKCIAESLGLNFVEVSCLSFLGESAKATEIRIRNVFRNAQQSTPAILYLTDVEVRVIFCPHQAYVKPKNYIKIYPFYLFNQGYR